MSDHLIRPSANAARIQVTPQSAGWTYLDMAIVKVDAGTRLAHDTEDREVAITALEGSATITAGGETWTVARRGVFEEAATVVYVPPSTEITVVAGEEGFDMALGGAPAEGRYPAAIYRPGDYESQLRGGGAAHRQVNGILAAPIPAERLILFEVYVPRGTWSGWAPHCHDGYCDSPYLEETYYFRLDNNGFAMHRNWREDSDFDEVLVAHDGDCVLVTEGFHSSVASPGSNMYFLNYLAGEPQHDDRAQPPYFHPDHTWIDRDWNAGLMHLPAVTT